MSLRVKVKQLFCRHKLYILIEGDESEYKYVNGSAPLIVYRECLKCKLRFRRA
jgi:RNase P subunit RPR2